MEYMFISKTTFENLVNTYLNNLPECKCHKALVNLELLSTIKSVLLDPKNVNICDKNIREWVRKWFYIEEIIPGDYRVMDNWDWLKQDLVEKFVNNCTICATKKPSFHPLTAKPIIIAKNFLSRIQIIQMVNSNIFVILGIIFSKALISKRAVEVAAYLFKLFYALSSSPTILQSDNGKEFYASVIKELIKLWPSVKIINGRPHHLQSQSLVEKANGILQQKLGK
ncbi:KRAB-A domain-containing protein 2-like [Rhizophagus clarus]|uniref:KRAB-A domain-containing protein 2-like n=1 Tax=Rhizophagus clarus TaxID=94130 RepID=A0A8H3M5W0_9GLOM|nr:KRAB-A domain-containing protein 2-like [Rhizophagus clarus]